MHKIVRFIFLINQTDYWFIT